MNCEFKVEKLKLLYDLNPFVTELNLLFTEQTYESDSFQVLKLFRNFQSLTIKSSTKYSIKDEEINEILKNNIYLESVSIPNFSDEIGTNLLSLKKLKNLTISSLLKKNFDIKNKRTFRTKRFKFFRNFSITFKNSKIRRKFIL